MTASLARAELSVPGNTATLRWAAAAGALSNQYFVYVSRNGAPARIETSVTRTEVTLSALPGDVVSVSVAAVAGGAIGPRSPMSEPIRFGGAPPAPGKLVLSCATCGVSALVRFPGGTPYAIWPHPAGAWDFLQIGRFTSASPSQGLLRDRSSGGWLIANLGADALTPVASVTKSVFATGVPLTGDLDGDGMLEIVLQDRADADVEVWQARTGSLRRVIHLPLGAVYDPIAIEDLDGDGQRDLWIQHGTNGTVAVMLTDDLAVSGSAMIASSPPPGYTRVAGVADYDGDGRLDLLWRGDGGALAVALLRGDLLRPTASLRPLPVRAGDDKLVPRVSADLDGVPGAEIVAQSQVDGSAHALWASDTSGRRQLLYVPPGGAKFELIHASR